MSSRGAGGWERGTGKQEEELQECYLTLKVHLY